MTTKELAAALRSFSGRTKMVLDRVYTTVDQDGDKVQVQTDIATLQNELTGIAGSVDEWTPGT